MESGILTEHWCLCTGCCFDLSQRVCQHKMPVTMSKMNHIILPKVAIHPVHIESCLFCGNPMAWSSSIPSWLSGSVGSRGCKILGQGQRVGSKLRHTVEDGGAFQNGTNGRNRYMSTIHVKKLCRDIQGLRQGAGPNH